MKLQKAAFIGLVAAGIGLVVMTTSAQLRTSVASGALYPDPDGSVATVSTAGKVDLTNPFFQDLGTNGRSCATCHQLSDGMSITPPHIQDRFNQTAGLDPLFRTNDGSNCDHNIDVTTIAGRQRAYSLLTNRGLIRVGLAVPDGAEFEVVNVNNPYGCSETTTLSMYRRPLPATNLRFLSAIMWDGRESTSPTTQKISYDTNAVDLATDLAHQAVDATNGHAQAAFSLSAGQQQAIVDFETSLFTAQAVDRVADALNAGGATGGPDALVNQAFYVGINDSLGLNPKSTTFTPTVFTLFGALARQVGQPNRPGPGGPGGPGLAPPPPPPPPAPGPQASIARGEVLFNTRPINITGVGGLNDVLAQPSIAGTCSTCHDSPNVGNHSIGTPLNIGVSNPGGPLNPTYLPVITLRNKTTREIVRTTDPGRAVVTGKWDDVSKMKVPVLRGLASRAPYFHNGAAQTIPDVVDFYNRRFNMRLSPQDRDDLAAFLGAL